MIYDWNIVLQIENDNTSGKGYFNPFKFNRGGR